ncbi:MAG: glycosyltransferase family 4 protein [Desulfuromonadales bacterium]
MLLTSVTFKGRNAIGDGYKDIVNTLSEQYAVAAVLPNAYSPEEFSEKIKLSFPDPFADCGKIRSAVRAIGFAWKLRNVVREQNIRKVFLYFDADWLNLFLVLMFRGLPIEYYVFVHDPILHSGEKLEFILRRWLVARLLFSRARKLFVSFSQGKRDLVSRYAVDPERVSVVFLPELTCLQFPELRDSEKKLGNYPFDLMFFGRLETYKGWRLLVDCLDLLKQKVGRDVTLLVIGRGTDTAEFKRAIAGCSTVRYIEDYIENRQLAEYIIQSRVIVLPYLDATGTQTVQTANYYNKPVVVSSAGCFSDYVISGVNGVVVDDLTPEGLAEAIVRLLPESEYYASIKRHVSSHFEETFRLNKILVQLVTEMGL